MNDETFEERIARIRARTGPASASAPAEPAAPRQAATPRAGGALRIAVSILGLVLATGGLLAGVHFAGPKLRALDMSAIAAALPTGQTGMNAVRGPGAERADPAREETDTGTIFRGTAVAAEGRPALDLADVVAAALPVAPPAAVVPFEPNETCTLSPPAPGDAVMGVRIEHGTGPVHMSAFDDAALAATVRANVERLTVDGRPLGTARAKGELPRVEVVVTRTDAPVHLLLQSERPVLWSLHAAPGARISHVALVSLGASAVTGLGAATFEAVRTEDFPSRQEIGLAEPVDGCFTHAVRAPLPHWKSVLRAESQPGNTLMVDIAMRHALGHAAYADWYESALGVPAARATVSARGAAHVLLGPVPETPLALGAAPADPAFVMRTDHVVAGPPDVIATAVDRLHLTLLAAAAGGDPSLLDPPAQHRSAR